jgi:hypothetical protein
MHKKINSAITAVLIVLLATAVFQALPIFSPKVSAAGTITDTVKISPMTTTLVGMPVTLNYWVNVTSTGSTYINSVCIEFPTGWTYSGGVVTIVAGELWTTTLVAGSSWLNFTTASMLFLSGAAIANFSIPAKISIVPPTGGTWTVYCYQSGTGSSSNPVTIPVTASLEFHATISPFYVKGGTSQKYVVTVTNDLSPVGITAINVTFPAAHWTFNSLIAYSPNTWTPTFNAPNLFVCTGPPILEGGSLTLQVNMTVPAITGLEKWNASARDSSKTFLGVYTITAVIDSTVPTITPKAPTVSYYSVGSGRYVWINFTVQDTPNMAAYLTGYTIALNDSRFLLSQAPVEVDSTHYNYYYVNSTVIHDGPLAVKVTAEDPATNTGTITISTIVDNTKPRLLYIYVMDQNSVYLYQDKSGTFWMESVTTKIWVWAAFYNPSGFIGKIYFNTTSFTFNALTNDTWIPSAGYSVGTSNLVIMNITLTDGSLPIANVYTHAWNIKREITKPSAPSFTKISYIDGGAIIYNLTATDEVGILYYEVFYNESLVGYIYPTWLNSSTLLQEYYFAMVKNITVFDLFDRYSAGNIANVTIQAVNYGTNMGPGLTLNGTSMIKVARGMWYPIEMYPKWNLLSLPLIPANTATSNIYSLMLLHGAAGVKFTYAFNNVTQQYVIPTTMVDGKGYWIYMNAYDVLIVQGYPIEQPPGSPPVPVQYSLTTGWNLAGYTETYEMEGLYYVASLTLTATTASYFRFVYVWDAQYQYWYVVDLYANSPFDYYLEPGQGFFIYMYSSQTLIPPL